MEVPDTITCVDCGQDARLMTRPPEDGWQPGDNLTYRCRGCNDRWDFILEEEDESQGTSAP